jgi:hypothetical protein
MFQKNPDFLSTRAWRPMIYYNINDFSRPKPVTISWFSRKDTIVAYLYSVQFFFGFCFEPFFTASLRINGILVRRWFEILMIFL